MDIPDPLHWSIATFGSGSVQLLGGLDEIGVGVPYLVSIDEELRPHDAASIQEKRSRIRDAIDPRGGFGVTNSVGVDRLASLIGKQGICEAVFV